MPCWRRCGAERSSTASSPCSPPRSATASISSVGLADVDGMVTSEGTIYPLLGRLRRDGLVESTWHESPTGPPRRYYRLTDAGRAGARRLQAGMEPVPRRSRPLVEGRAGHDLQRRSLVEDYLSGSIASSATCRGRAGGSSTEEIAWHIAEGRAGLRSDDEAGVRNLLERLGDPAEIAAEERARPGSSRARAGYSEIVALVGLLVGGFVLPSSVGSSASCSCGSPRPGRRGRSSSGRSSCPAALCRPS